MAVATPLNDQLDLQLKHEAALLHADGEQRQAVAMLINRINETKGYCNIWIWLLVLDLYRVSNSLAPYEKLALHFSQQTGAQAPACDPQENVRPTGKDTWRNALILEGSPLSVDDEKFRDWIQASRETGQSRLDLSRLRLDASEEPARAEAERLLTAMQRLRRTGARVLLMGETEMANRLDRRIEGGGQNREMETPWWELRMELHQWRGEEEMFDALADDYAQRFAFCPVDYDPQGAVAVSPADSDMVSQDAQTDVLELPFQVNDSTALLTWIAEHWDAGKDARISMQRCGRMSAQVARETVQFLLARHGIGAPGGESAELPPGSRLHFLECSPLLSALLEVTGVSAYATVEDRDAKLLALRSDRSAKRQAI
jgi:hypothetical protein